MENAIDALKIAADVLVFVLALSLSLNAFSEVRQTSQIILDYQDREYEYSYVEDNGSTQRIVSGETIIPSIYKAYKENYKIVFDIDALKSTGIYKKVNNEGETDNINYIDLEKEVLGNDSQKERFIMAILYGADEATKKEFQTNLGIYLNDEGIYDKIIKKEFKESLGVYYQEEVNGESYLPDINKTKKRVITYTDI